MTSWRLSQSPASFTARLSRPGVSTAQEKNEASSASGGTGDWRQQAWTDELALRGRTASSGKAKSIASNKVIGESSWHHGTAWKILEGSGNNIFQTGAAETGGGGGGRKEKERY